MKLKCNINGIEYQIVQGATFVENYNETLDSATIILKPTKIIQKIDPYDDVFVYEGKFNGYGSNVSYEGRFYKHLLFDRIEKNSLRLEDNPKNTLYRYTLYLFSETKGLEGVSLPNKSITEPLPINLKKSAYQYMKEAVDLYSPIYKKAGENNTWAYVQKYTLDPSLEEIFDNLYCPDFTLDNPNLRDYLSKIMIIKDMIPYVQDGVIKGLDITERKGNFNADKRYVKRLAGQKTSEDYCNGLRRTYYDAISEDNSCKLTEFLGFRNKNNSLLSFSNLSLETRFPIYKINKFYMCYYKRIKCYVVTNPNTQEREEQDKYFLCKQDITPLIKLDVERNVLSQDWTEWQRNSKDGLLKSVEDLAKYKFATIGYSIGSKTISGWGERMTYYSNSNIPIWNKESTYVQNIFEYMDKLYPVGIYDFNYLKEIFSLNDDDLIIPLTDNFANAIISEYGTDYPASLKGLFFQVEYNAFYSGAIIASKENSERDDIIINDNSSSSLAILEKDGLAQQEKVNRFSNENIQLPARYPDISYLQELGSVYNDELDQDIIIYHREYSIWDTEVVCNYVGSKDYVQKNFFTSVYAKHRPYALMSYGESIRRAENKKAYLLLSKTKQYYEDFGVETVDEEEVMINKTLAFIDFNPITKILSFFKPTHITPISQQETRGYFDNVDLINYGYIECKSPNYDENDNLTNYSIKKFASDINVFSSGNSVCFNLAMDENVAAGVYLDKDQLIPSVAITDVNRDHVGSIQKWYLTTDNILTGFLKNISFYVAHYDSYKQKELITTDTAVKAEHDKILALPKIEPEANTLSNIFGGNFNMNKDNKEIVDMTLQIETIKDSDDIIFSPWMTRLSDLTCTRTKRVAATEAIGTQNNANYCKIHYGTLNIGQSDNIANYACIILSFKTLHNIQEQNYNFTCEYYDTETLETANINYIKIQFINNDETATINPIVVSDDWIRLNANIIAHDENGTYTNANQRVFFSRVVENSNTGANTMVIQDQGLHDHSIRMIYSTTSGGGTTKHTCVPEGETWFMAVFGIQGDNSDYIQTPLLTNGRGGEMAVLLPTYYAMGYDNTVITATGGSAQSTFPSNISSLISFWQYYTRFITYPQNIFAVDSDKTMSKSIIYEERASITASLRSIANIISFDSQNNMIINVVQAGSVQFWYLDDYGAYHFIFGVNVTAQDVATGYIKIYTSLLSHKDPRVFDNNHRVVGKIKNIADSNIDRNVQKYEEEDTDE